jgi:Putative prokaryotic signal transducing protein
MAADRVGQCGWQGIVNAGLDGLAAHFAELTDAVLLERLRSGALTEAAAGVAKHELRSRGIEFSQEPAPDYIPFDATQPDPDIGGDMVSLVVNLVPTEAHILQARLDSEGIHAIVADAHLAQVGWAIPAAAGGARVLVAAAQFEQAKAILARLQNGEYRLDDQEDESAACPRCAGTKLTAFIPGFLASVFKYSGPSQRLRCDSCGHTWPNSTSSL